jgi:hypothetical protein
VYLSLDCTEHKHLLWYNEMKHNKTIYIRRTGTSICCYGVGASLMMRSGTGDSSMGRRGVAGALDTGAKRRSTSSDGGGVRLQPPGRGSGSGRRAGGERHGLQPPGRRGTGSRHRRAEGQAAATDDPSRAEPHFFSFCLVTVRSTGPTVF